MLTPEDQRWLAESACSAARAAGGFIRRSRPGPVERKAGGQSEASQVVTETDRRSQEIILEALEESVARFSLGVLSEELEDDGGRLERDLFWSIDPLDGTLPYAESRPGYAVSIALVSRTGVPQIGVIMDPVQDTLYCARRGGGVTRNGAPWTRPRPRNDVGLSVFADRSLVTMPGYAAVTAALDGASMEMGGTPARVLLGSGAVMNACQVLESPAACYFKFPRKEDGGGALWDFAASACLFAEADAVATNIHGGPLDLNRADSTWMNHEGVLYASDRALAARIAGIYRDWRAASGA